MKIVLIGSGNIATHLGKAFTNAGHQIIQVYSRTLANASALANLLSSNPVDQLHLIEPSADLYLLAVSDAAIEEVSNTIDKHIKGIIVHCSGATPITVLNQFHQYGVIYPIQSFSKNETLDLNQTPFGIEGNSATVSEILTNLTSQISNKVFSCDSNQRLAIHVSAVFANNFTNALFQVAYDLLHEHNLSFDLIRPIILETAEKIQNNKPMTVQTGPASRNDLSTMETHFNFISSHPDWQLIYQKISALIIKRRENKS